MELLGVFKLRNPSPPYPTMRVEYGLLTEEPALVQGYSFVFKKQMLSYYELPHPKWQAEPLGVSFCILVCRQLIPRDFIQ